MHPFLCSKLGSPLRRPEAVQYSSPRLYPSAGSVRRKDVTMERRNDTRNITVTEETTLRELLEMIGAVGRAEKTPTARALRERKREDGTVEQVRPLAETADGDCKVYANGYAVYSNNTGTTVLWLADCCSFTYQFDGLKDKEKDYIAQGSTVGEDILGNQPWFMAVMLRGDHQVERNSMDRKGDRRGQNKNISLDYVTEEEEEAAEWNPGYRFESPERALIRKEMLREQLGKLTDRQREVFLLYHQCGYTQQEIAEMLGVRQQSVYESLKAAEAKVRNFEKIFR